MKDDGQLRSSNRGKLRTAAKMAMTHPVLLCLDDEEVKTLSLATETMWRVQHRAKVGAWRVLYLDLGTFVAMPGETMYQVFVRLWDEAQSAGALLGERPTKAWVDG